MAMYISYYKKCVLDTVHHHVSEVSSSTALVS